MISTFNEATLPSGVLRLFGDLPARHGRRSIATSMGAATACGVGRDHNEDCYGTRSERIFAVADGMGGRPGGAQAALAAIAATLDLIERADTHDWHATISTVNEAVRAEARAAGRDRSGAALGLVELHGAGATILHLGDVRIYRIRRGAVQLLTVDHTIADELAGSGLDPARLGLRQAELAALTVYLGDPDSASRFAVRTITVETGDRLVLCTDGVHRHREPIWPDLEVVSDVEVADRLVSRAVESGSDDDASAMVLTLGFAEGKT
ncbi:MAG: protein phosphatase 2C domain-containing protein [Ilumatobacteraceae bacterium]